MVDDEGNVDDMIEFVHELSAAWMTKVHDLTEIVLAKGKARLQSMPTYAKRFGKFRLKLHLIESKHSKCQSRVLG